MRALYAVPSPARAARLWHADRPAVACCAWCHWHRRFSTAQALPSPPRRTAGEKKGPPASGQGARPLAHACHRQAPGAPVVSSTVYAWPSPAMRSSRPSQPTSAAASSGRSLVPTCAYAPRACSSPGPAQTRRAQLLQPQGDADRRQAVGDVGSQRALESADSQQAFGRRGQPADSQQGEAAVRPAAPAARLWKSRAALPACRTPAGRLLAPARRPHRRSARRTLPIVSAGRACRRAPPPLRRAAGRARAAPAARAPSKTRLPRSLMKVDARSRFLGGYLRWIRLPQVCGRPGAGRHERSKAEGRDAHRSLSLRDALTSPQAKHAAAWSGSRKSAAMGA